MAAEYLKGCEEEGWLRVWKWHLCLPNRISAHCPSCSHTVPFICLFSLSTSFSRQTTEHCGCGLLFYDLICAIPELLLERQLAVWCRSLLIINVSSERGLHKACQPISTRFILCTTLFLCTPMQGRLEIRGSHSAGIKLTLSTIPGIQRCLHWTTFLLLCHSCLSPHVTTCTLKVIIRNA